MISAPSLYGPFTRGERISPGWQIFWLPERQYHPGIYDFQRNRAPGTDRNTGIDGGGADEKSLPGKKCRIMLDYAAIIWKNNKEND